ncbi:MAG: hypothetical protein H6818_24175 [Phycisphaerales bacterium]|nr:hypothetical protein [Phycisphaerales bacterium]
MNRGGDAGNCLDREIALFRQFGNAIEPGPAKRCFDEGVPACGRALRKTDELGHGEIQMLLDQGLQHRRFHLESADALPVGQVIQIPAALAQDITISL